MPAHFSLATPDDDPVLRSLLRVLPMPGAVRLTYEREPSFFAADPALGEHVQTLVARERDGGPPVAVVSRATRTVFLDGRPERVGYLSGLRVHPDHQGQAIVGRGWTALRKLHEADPVPFYLLSVTAENDRTARLLTLRRGDAPAFMALADLVTLALLTHRRHRTRNATDPAAAAALRQRLGPTCDLFPAAPLALPSLGPDDEIVVRRSGQPVGALALWDASSVRQSVVRGYGGRLGWLRPLLNGVARLTGARPLPPVGAPLRSAFAVRPTAHDAAAFDVLLDAALAAARRRDLAFLLVGFDARDPYLARARRRLHVPYHSRLYAAHWSDGAPPRLHAPLHAEIATY